MMMSTEYMNATSTARTEDGICPINLIVAVQDHAPVRIEELNEEEGRLEHRLRLLREERATLHRLVAALEMPVTSAESAGTPTSSR